MLASCDFRVLNGHGVSDRKDYCPIPQRDRCDNAQRLALCLNAAGLAVVQDLTGRSRTAM
jgi:hypothetical protein